MIKKIKSKFEEEVKNVSKVSTPGTPGKRIKAKFKNEEMLTKELQTKLRSRVRMLLFMVKHSQPDIANAVRELLKCMGKANYNAYKELLRVIKFILDTPDYGLKLVIKETNAIEDQVQIVTFVNAE